MDNRSFSLLEVIAAVSLLAIAAVGIIQGQAGSVRNVLQSEKLSQAYFLAQQKMIDTELEIVAKGLQAFLPEEKGEFDDEALKEFKWVRRLDPIDIACYWPEAGSEDNRAADPAMGMISQVFENFVRKVVVEVEWIEGNKTRSASLAQLFVHEEGIRNLSSQFTMPGTGGGGGAPKPEE
jgi:type II secretory pathway pseudopilin PulG